MSFNEYPRTPSKGDYPGLDWETIGTGNINSHAFRLIDDERFIGQLLALERRAGRSGRDSVDHAPGAHDDLANAGLGALVLASSGAASVAYTREDREQFAREQGFSVDQQADPLAAF